MTINIYKPEFDETRKQSGFTCLRSRIGQQIGSQKLGLSLWQLPPGQTAYPYHYHLSEEELLIVLRGTPKLRTQTGWRTLAKGEVVSFPVGENGSHQLTNPTEQIVEFLAVSTNGQPDIVIYPDSQKLGANERNWDGSGLRKLFRIQDAVDYWQGEKPPDTPANGHQ